MLLMQGCEDICSVCGNDDPETIMAVPRNYHPPGAFGRSATANLWWLCSKCHHEWPERN